MAAPAGAQEADTNQHGPMMTNTVQRQLEDAICGPLATPGDTYAILDGAVVRQLPDAFEAMRVPHACLFRGETDPLVLTRAPWLVKLEPGTEALAWILREGWGRNWGMFAAVPRDTKFDEVLEHFRQFIQVRLPDGRIVFFRFYDPRVQRLFVPSCDAAQAALLFSLPLAWMCESEEGASLITCTEKDGAVQRSELSLSSFRDAIPAR
jgi:Domain of unknown function (DUF4123)